MRTSAWLRVNAPLRAQRSTEVDVVLGADVFDAHAAVVDYPGQSLFLKAVPAELDAAAEGGK